MNHAKLLSEAFSALEKQAIRERANQSNHGWFDTAKYDVIQLLNALDERDQEVERYRKAYYSEAKLVSSFIQTNQRLKNALEEILDTYLCECGDPYKDCSCGFDEIRKIARQALAGDEK